MPIYEYVCQDCRHHFEKLVNGSAATSCPSCNGHKLKQQFSTFAVGGRGTKSAPTERIGACRSCGDPRGPGACSLN